MHNKPHNQAMILAAGVGSRLDPLTQAIPKPLVPIVGIPVMEHIINLCKSHGFTNLAANIHVRANKMMEYFKDANEKFGVNLNLVHEKELTGVAGGIRSCKQYLTDDVILVIMGDALTDIDLSRIYEAHIKSNCEVTCAIKEVEDTSQYGVVVIDKNNRVISFQEKPKQEEAKSNLANTGIYFFNQKILSEIPSFKEAPKYDVATDLFQKLMTKNIPLQGIKIQKYWADIGTLKQYKQSIKDVLEDKVKITVSGEKTYYGYKERNSHIHPTLKVLGKAYIGRNVQIGGNVTFSGTVSIEDGCKISDGCYIDNSILWPNTTISKNTKVINSIVGSSCIVDEGVDVISNSVWGPGTRIEKTSKPSVVLK